MQSTDTAKPILKTRPIPHERRHDFRRIHNEAHADHRIPGLHGPVTARRTGTPQGKGCGTQCGAQATDGVDRSQGQGQPPPRGADGPASRQSRVADKGP